MLPFFVFLTLSAVLCASEPTAEPKALPTDTQTDPEEPPEGYYAFVESPNATPPRVRPPPYRQVASECAEATESRAHVSANNLCGDLNRGLIPRNPMGQNPNGEPYPFELIRNHTLRYLSRTLPVLRADDALPRVAHVASATSATGAAATSATPPSATYGAPLPHAVPDMHHNRLEERNKRAASEVDASETGAKRAVARESRKFCDGGGVFCMLYRAINGDSAGPERREDPGVVPHTPHAPHRYEGPPTPCPARVEYATPVFARNYQGVWRYVVQIPYEGYFTQTVEVTRCMQSRCHYLEGGCLSSPRWVSLLVAELHYPPDAQEQYQQFANQKGDVTTEKPLHCDGHDELGCYQVRLYYDWFLVPGSCKCWRPDYFARYVRRKHNEL
ncbi:uncharacterized protein LOC119836781 isoform X2 [Zerene cesonia]|uniref:uncharacterized protein LOC119836781 isoform X2 n=1 Tax=Zerene cesonia TaxID=33412 RepID=UPI0018E55B5A|nr:uncharacterized protein LOC119836781 isoform X2 [Zerene cesonia]